MKLYLYILYFVRTITAECPPDEVMVFCKSPCQPSCQNPIPNKCFFTSCKAGCVCKDGFLRNELTGKCVDPKFCPLDCAIDEVENLLNVCEPRCPDKEQSYPYLVEIKKCICKSGLVRHLDKCIPLSECPNVCGENEVLSNCTNIKCRKTCQNRHKNIVCSPDCSVGCVCKDNYIWDENQSKCVNEEKCTPKCGKNEEFRRCSDKLCRTTCKNIGQPNPCPKICQSGCSCKRNYVYDEIKKECIHKDYCSRGKNQDLLHKRLIKPLVCKENEEWSNCVNSCQQTCHYPGKEYCTLDCKSGCKCKKDFLWDKYQKRCVRKRDCSQICGENQEWCDYIPGDLPTCQSLTKPMAKKWYSLSFVALKPGCICKNGFILNDDTQECIDLNDCLSGNYSTTGTTITESITKPDYHTDSTISSTETTKDVTNGATDIPTIQQNVSHK